jgi:hypothetical protein
LEAFAAVTDQDFAAEIGVITFIAEAEIVIEIHAAFDDLAAAIAFDLEDVISFFGFGGRPAEEILEKAHNDPSFGVRRLAAAGLE